MFSLLAHNAWDYIAGATLLAAPQLFGFSHVRVARNTCRAFGAGIIGYSLMTDYKYSVIRAIPLRTHMALDAASGMALMIAPRALGYHRALSDSQNAFTSYWA